MTRRRFDEHSTPFGEWLREQELIDSSLGFIASNLDYIWANYETKNLMLLEEKRFSGTLTYSQKELFSRLDNCLKSMSGCGLLDYKYWGFHFIQFENTSPEDGAIYLDGRLISKDELLKFLRFELPEPHYSLNILSGDYTKTVQELKMQATR